MKDRTKEQKPSAVPETAEQGYLESASMGSYKAALVDYPTGMPEMAATRRYREGQQRQSIALLAYWR